MDMNDMILVSIDDHMIEPPDMFKNHVPAKFADDVPKVVRNADGVDEWVFQGEKTRTWPQSRTFPATPGLASYTVNGRSRSVAARAASNPIGPAPRMATRGAVWGMVSSVTCSLAGALVLTSQSTHQRMSLRVR